MQRKKGVHREYKKMGYREWSEGAKMLLKRRLWRGKKRDRKAVKNIKRGKRPPCVKKGIKVIVKQNL